MRIVFLLSLFVLVPSCSGGERNEAKARTQESARVSDRFRPYVYPKAEVKGIYSGREASGITMKSEDPIEKVAKFYLERLGLPYDKVVGSQVVSYLYKGEDGDVLITVEKSDGGSVISVSITSKGRK